MANDTCSADMQEIWSLFAQEGRDNLALAETALLRLEQNRAETDQVAALFRAIHSFKGGARMMGLSVLESLSHHAEDLIALVRDEGVSLQADLIEALFAALDKSRVMLDQVLASGCDVEPIEAQATIDILQQLLIRYEPATADEPLPADRSEIVRGEEPIEVLAPAPIMIEPPTPDSIAPASTAPLSLTEFLHGAEQDLARLHAALEVTAIEPVQGLTQLQAVCSDLKCAAERLGFERLIDVLDELSGTAEVGASSPSLEELLNQLRKLELDLFEEITRIEEAAPDRSEQPDDSPAPDRTDIAWLFRHWHADRVFVDLARLRELTDQLDRLEQRFTADIDASRQIERLADEASVLLRALCHSCTFYHLDQAVHVTLALEDLYARVVQAELVLNAALTQLTRDYIDQLDDAIEAIREGEAPPLATLAALIDQIETVLYLHVDGPAHQVARSALEALDLPPQFQEVMTPEAWAQFGQSLQAGDQFYTVLADLEHGEALGQAFFEWSNSAGIHLITNVTIQDSAGPLFDFLIATQRSRESLSADIVQIDRSGQYMTLQECLLRQGAEPPRPLARQSAGKNDAPVDQPTSSGASIAAPVLARLIETAGELAVHHATLHRVAGRLTETELVEPILRAMQAAQGDWTRARYNLKALLNDWLEDVHTLGQVERDVGTALDQLQESTRQLRLVPAAELLAPLQQLVRDLGRQLNKTVELTTQGAELDIDRSAIEVVAEPLRQLVWFAVVHSIETVERRQALGKPAVGRIVVTVDPHDDHLQVVIEDDGRGLDRTLILQHVQELQWVDHQVGTADDLDLNLIFRPDFGRVGGLDGVDLSALDNQLQAHHGRLSVTSDPDYGSRFVVRLPLDMAVVDGMVVRAGSVRYVIPVSAIRRIVQPAATDLIHSSADGQHTLLRTDGEVVQIRALGREDSAGTSDHVMVIVNCEHGSVALAVDELIGRQQVMARPLQGHLSEVRDASGCALLGEGEVGMILNLSAVGSARSSIFDLPRHAAPKLEAAVLC